MDNNKQTMQPNSNANSSANSKESTEMLNKKIKETWSGLSDSDINLYHGKPEEFFAKLKEKSNVSKEDAMKKIHQLEKDCGCSSAAKAA